VSGFFSWFFLRSVDLIVFCSGSVSSSGNSAGGSLSRARSKTGHGLSGNLLPKPFARKNSIVNVLEGGQQQLEYLFCVAGDIEG
jgi:hypothetical protein